MVGPAWLDWAARLEAIAQTGLAYEPSDYDSDRYRAVREIAGEIVAAGSGAPIEDVRGLLAGDIGHATPKVDVRGGVFRAGEILLVRELADGRWTLPGGWADIGESPSEAVEREVREESGYEVRAAKLAALWDRRRHSHTPHLWHLYYLFFVCELVSDEPRPVAGETDGVGFFPEDALPELSTGRVTLAQIARLFEHDRDPVRPTDFD